MAENNFTTTRISLEAAVAIILFGFIGVVVKYVSANVFTIGFIRLVITLFAIFLFFRFKGSLRLPTKKEILPLATIGFCFGLHWLTYFLSIKIATVSIAVLSLSSYGIFLLILGWIFQKTKPSWTDILAVLGAVWGNIVIMPEFSLENNITLGVLFGLVSGFAFALLPILHQKNRKIPTPTRALGQFFFALCFFLFFMPAYDWEISANDWWALIILSVFCTFVAHTLWIHVTTRLSTLTTSLIYYMIIPIAMAASYFLLGEEINSAKMFGGGLIVSANLLGLFSQWKRRVIID